MNLIYEFPFIKFDTETVIEFEYPFNTNQRDDFLPSVRQIFLRGVRPSVDGIVITDVQLLAEAIEWLKQHVRKGAYRVHGRFEKIVCQTKDGAEVMVDGDGVRWGVVFRFLRDEDAILFKLRFG
jgi:hypothetical protein